MFTSHTTLHINILVYKYNKYVQVRQLYTHTYTYVGYMHTHIHTQMHTYAHTFTYLHI